jgi:hypothetical protein
MHPSPEWQLRVISSEDCQSYLAWNERTHEALAIDPKLDDWDAYVAIYKDLQSYRWLGVVDTHTQCGPHSCADRLASVIQAPVFMHHLSGTSRVSFRVGRNNIFFNSCRTFSFYLTPDTRPMGCAWSGVLSVSLGYGLI